MKSKADVPPRVMVHPYFVASNDNQYAVLLRRALPPWVTPEPFSWRRFVLADYDILHVNWPEALIQGTSPIRSLAKTFTFVLGVVLARIRHRTLIGTVHNLRPHDGLGKWQAQAWRWWHRRCDARIYLTKKGAQRAELGPGVCIPHANYDPELQFHAIEPRKRVREPGEPTRCISFGQLRPYKRIPQLIDQVGSTRGLTLAIAGNAESTSLAAEIIGRAAEYPHVRLVLGRLSFTELCQLILDCDVSVIVYDQPYNSGAALLSLTLGRPVLSTTSSTMLELQEEFGESWIGLIPSDWNSLDLSRGCTQLAERAAFRSPRPDMSQRDWKLIGRAHAEIYVDALRKNGRR